MLSGILSIILETVGGFISMMLLVRTAMRWMRMSFVSQVGQFVLATTNWIVLPAQRVLPSVGKLDTCSLVPAWLIESLLVAISVLLTAGGFGNPATALVGVLAIGALELVKVALYLLMGVVIISAVLSWVNPYSPLAPTLNQLTRPLLAPFRRVIPPVGGVDLSPLVLLLVVQIALFVLQGIRAGFTPLLFQ
ncbi:YggT family protein [Uliginosibacterium sp. H1]|uniref:YggT family protein n=1 Tax=Uliginosibacterium sp. H1 TaxID=3114757 RepID=UPI002E17D4AC|nr:YggT family protein [Uliginosibacterium sp. H1]